MKASFFVLAIPILAQQSANFYSVEKERALGQHLSSEIRRQAKPLSVPLVDEYTKRLGGELVAQLEETSFGYQFKVIADGAHIEPIPLPGGYILIPARFFTASQDESEFVGMLAHAIGHVALRHGTQARTRGQTVNMASIPLIFWGGWAGSHADAERSQLLMPTAFLKFQRIYELEADRFGLQLASRAGYDAAGLKHYIQRTDPADATREQRLAALQETLSSLPSPAASTSSEEFRRVQQTIQSTMAAPTGRRRAPTLKR
ncbi:MAG TPA: M48 family metalloprotease [Bryobacteraceae bacterium]|nr:M48 family metalloprotease [Bryobacteraceae bacterium]